MVTSIDGSGRNSFWAQIYFDALSCKKETTLTQRVAAWAVTVFTGIIPALLVAAVSLTLHIRKWRRQGPVPVTISPKPQESEQIRYSLESLKKHPQSAAMKESFPHLWAKLVQEPLLTLDPAKEQMIVKALKSFIDSNIKAEPLKFFKMSDTQRQRFRSFNCDTSSLLDESCVFDASVQTQACFVNGYYTYRPDHQGQPAVVVDFANKYFGGGVLNHGFVQEEKMLFEMLQLMEYLLSQDLVHQAGPGLQTRRPLGDGLDEEEADLPAQGHPDPFLFLNVSRSLCIDDHLYGTYGRRQTAEGETLMVGYQEASEKELDQWIQPRQRPFEKAHVLTLAAPRLTSRSEDLQYHSLVIQDLLMTAFAGFTLVKTHTSCATIRTGKWGCGAFNNHPLVAYLAQRLAASIAGIQHIEFYGYSHDEQEQCELAWQRLLISGIGAPEAVSLKYAIELIGFLASST